MRKMERRIAMSPFPDPITLRQLPLISRIIQDETWLEGERRGCAVSPDDPVVRGNVCAVVLRIGREVRERLTVEAAREATRQRSAKNAATAVSPRSDTLSPAA